MLVFVVAVSVLVLNRQEIQARLNTWLRQNSSRSRVEYLLVGCVCLIILVWAAGPVRVYDTGLYHAQGIRWAETYPAAPGLGNLHLRLAFSPLWFSVNALFGFSWILPEPRHSLDGLLAVWTALYLLRKMKESRHSRGIYVFYALLFAGLMYQKAQFGSPDPSFAVSVLFWMVLTLLWESDPTEFHDLSGRVALAIMCSVGSVAIKLSAIPVLLVPLYLLFRGGKKTRAFVVVTALVVGIPWLAQNYVLTGYLVVPFSSTQWGHPDWKVPVEIIESYRRAIEVFARVQSMAATDQVVQSGYAYWFPIWFKMQKPETVVCLGIIVVSALVLGGVFLRNKWRRLLFASPLGRFALLWWIAFGGVCFWFVSAPDPRFGWGYLVLAASFGSALAVERLLPNKCPAMAIPQICVVLVAFGISLQKIGRQVSWKYLLNPASYPRPTMKNVPVEGGSIWVPAQGYQTWYFSFPSAPGVGQRLQLRGADLRSGYRTGQ